MNIYLVSQTVNDDFDTYSSFVVICKDEDIARHTLPDGLLMTEETHWTFSRTWTTPENVDVKLLGIALPDIEPGIICASFHAG